MPALTADSKLNVAWQPIPGTSQELALDSRCHHTLYTGARGPGKTDCQLQRFRRRVGMGYGAFWRGVIFDREYKNLDDLVAKSKRWFNADGGGGRFLESGSSYKWVWPGGEELLFRVVKKEADYWNYHGQEFPFIGWNELTKYPTPSLYDALMSCNRSSFTPLKDTPRKSNGGPAWTDEELAQNGEAIPYDTVDGKPLPDIPLEVFSTTNPYGPGHTWVKRRFIDPAPYGHVVRTTTNVFNPRTQRDEDIVKTQVAIFGSFRENIYLSPEYVVELYKNTDENTKRAWLYGDWNIVAGGALSDLWRKAVHEVPRFVVPAGWKLDRAFDWGSSHPFAVLWFAEANGEEAVLPNGVKFCPPPGTLVVFHEWYGTKAIGTNKGLMLSAGDIAIGIRDREIELLKRGWILKQPAPGPADNQIRDVREKDVDTIETKMAKVGVRWTESDKSAGSRKIGLQLVRDRLEASNRQEGPGLYVMSHCRAAIEIWPNLPRDEDNLDDVDTSAEDHNYDALRYRVLKGSNRYATRINVKHPT